MVKSEEFLARANESISPQAKLFSLGYLMLFVSMIMTVIIKKTFNTTIMLAVFVNVVVFIISVYVVNCTVTGGCNIYAWVVAYILIVLGVFSSIGTILVISKN